MEFTKLHKKEHISLGVFLTTVSNFRINMSSTWCSSCIFVKSWNDSHAVKDTWYSSCRMQEIVAYFKFLRIWTMLWITTGLHKTYCIGCRNGCFLLKLGMELNTDQCWFMSEIFYFIKSIVNLCAPLWGGCFYDQKSERLGQFSVSSF